jgi:chemotaxis protein CheX
MILTILIKQSKIFLNKYIKVKDIVVKDIALAHFKLKDYTSMVYMSGNINIVVIISFKESILHNIVDVFMDGDKVEKDKKKKIYNSVTSETINTIAGLSISHFPNKGKGVIMSTPITVDSILNIKGFENKNILSAEIITEFGDLEVGIICDKITNDKIINKKDIG